MNPDPNQALTAYNAPPAPYADMVFTPQEAAAPLPAEADSALQQMMAQRLAQPAVPPPQPDPQAALAAYQGQPTPTTSMGAMANVGGAIDAQKQANMGRAGVAADSADQASRVLGEQSVNADMSAEELKMAHEEHASDIAKLSGEDASIAKDRGDIGKRSMFSRVAGAMAVAMGGFQDQTNLVAGLNMGLNVQTHNADRVAAMINTQIDRDIAVQREKLSGRTAEQATKRGDARQGYQENIQAVQLAHAAKIESAQSALQQIAANAQSLDARNTAEGANAQLEEKKQGLYMGVIQQREADRARAAAASARANAPKAVDWGRDFTPQQLQAMADAGVLPADGHKVLKASAPTPAPAGPATEAGALTGYVSTQPLGAGDQSVARQIDSATRSLEKDYDTLAAMRKKNGDAAAWNADDQNEAQRILNSMPAKFSQTFGAGAPSKTEMEIFQESLVNPTAMHARIHPLEAYKRGKESIRNNATSRLDSYGYKPQNVRFTPDGK